LVNGLKKMINSNLHPLDSNEVIKVMLQFLADVIFEYRDHEIKDWLQGLTLDSIEAIVNKPGNEDLQKNTFVIPFTYLHYAVVPPASIVNAMKGWLEKHSLISSDNQVLQKTKLNFDRIFKGKTEFIHDPNNGGHKS
jgi:hypothetical protein